MSEKLSTEANETARQYAATEAHLGHLIGQELFYAENLRDAGIEDLAQSAEANAKELADPRDANLWRAQQHKNQHLDEYIETARQEAQAQGVQINIQQSAEGAQSVEVHTSQQ